MQTGCSPLLRKTSSPGIMPPMKYREIVADKAAGFLAGINEQTFSEENGWIKINQFKLEQNDRKAYRLLQCRLAQTLLLVSTTRPGNRSGLLSCSAFLAISPGQKLRSNRGGIGASSPIGHQAEVLQTACNSWVYFPVPVTQALLRPDPVCGPLRGDRACQKFWEENQP